jgi:hypothetical protein
MRRIMSEQGGYELVDPSLGHLGQFGGSNMLAAKVPAVRLTRIGRSSIYEVMSIAILQFAD